MEPVVRIQPDLLKMKEDDHASNGFYFAVLRLLGRLWGDANEDAEGTAVEAYLGSIGIFVITFLVGLELFAGRFSGWRSIAFSILLVFAVWIFWLAVFYINSFVIRFLRACRLFRRTENRHAQSILIGLVVAGLAYQLSILNSSTRWVGVFVLLLLGANLLAALVLKLSRRR